jgi:hypothetical protein
VITSGLDGPFKLFELLNPFRLFVLLKALEPPGNAGVSAPDDKASMMAS